MDFVKQANDLVASGNPLVFMYATDNRAEKGIFTVSAVFGTLPTFTTISCEVKEGESYPSLTKTIMAAHWFERLIGDQFGIVAEGHPDWRRLIHHENIPAQTYPLRKDFAWNTKLDYASEPYPMGKVEGEGVYEIPVGPIHAGIIEPGHFRFNVRGERIITLEGKLFFKHKGVEKLLENKTPEEGLPFIERISGDMPVSHALAYVQAMETIAHTSLSERTLLLRSVWNELERITAHIFDLGNIAGMGTGFTFMAAQCFRLVEELRRTFFTLSGHRFLRGVISLGGVRDIDASALLALKNQLQSLQKELDTITDIAYSKDGLMERFETTGVLTHEAALAYGARGIGARASGVAKDYRVDYPYAGFTLRPIDIQVKKTGDVRARFSLRYLELQESLRWVLETLSSLPEGNTSASFSIQDGSSLGWTEGFRGAVIDWVQIKNGKIERCALSDPSFCNWALFGELGPGNIVPDFPLCNKSLNLSYSGTDL